MNLQAGETLLGGQMMALAIDGRARSKAATSSPPQDRSRRNMAAPRPKPNGSTRTLRRRARPEREGYMTILVYGHSEHVV